MVGAGWAGGYGREVRIAHGGGLMSLYGHMSEIVAAARQLRPPGQLIGYVGSSGLSTGPHLHYEVRQGGSRSIRLACASPARQVVDTQLADAVKARLKALLSVGVAQLSLSSPEADLRVGAWGEFRGAAPSQSQD